MKKCSSLHHYVHMTRCPRKDNRIECARTKRENIRVDTAAGQYFTSIDFTTMLQTNGL